MSRNYYSEINLHVVWHTKNSLPLLTPTIERATHRVLRKRLIDTPDVFLHEIGGTESHVHLAVTIPPTLTISEWIGKLKGGTSYDVNQQIGKRQKGPPVGGRLPRGEFWNGRLGAGEGIRARAARTSRARDGPRPSRTYHAVRRPAVTPIGSSHSGEKARERASAPDRVAHITPA